MKLTDLLSNLDKIVAFGGFASAAGLLGYVVEKGYQDSLGFSIPIDNKAYADAFRDFLKQAGSLLLDGLKSPTGLLIILLLVLFIAIPSKWFVRFTSRIRRGTVAWVAPPALLCLGSALVFYPATDLQNLLPDAFAARPFQLDPDHRSFSSGLRDMVVCAQVPAVSSRPLLRAIKDYCAARGFARAEDAKKGIERLFRWLCGVCLLAFALFMFARWCAADTGGNTAIPPNTVKMARLQVLTTLAAIGLVLDAFGLCSFYGKVVQLRPVDDAALYFVHSTDSGPLPCGGGPRPYRYGLILARTDKEYAFLCSEDLSIQSIAKDKVDHVDAQSQISPLTYAMQKRAERE